MARYMKKKSKKIGLPPGTLVHVGEQRAEKLHLTIMDFDESGFQEKEITQIEEAFPLKETPTVTWLNIDGLHDVEVIEKIGHHFGIHPLTLEDIVSTGQRPKMEDYDDYLFLVLKMIYYDAKRETVGSEQVSLVVGPHFLISFQEAQGDVFNPVRDRIRKGKGRIRRFGCDYLAYALIDAIVDNYFLVLEAVGEQVEALEEDVVENPTVETMQGIHAMKREMIYLRKQVWPLREVIGALARGESPLMGESTALYLRDVHDHAIQVIDTIESLRDVVAGMLDIYLSTVSNRMNEVMKVLTIIATIFIPLTFIAGVYGMNFKYMPELEWRWGYLAVWGLMVGTVIVLVAFFKRRNWL